jgi:hypothetical protein
MAKIKVERATGKVIHEESDLNHSHPGDVEPYAVLKNIGDIDMEGTGNDNVIVQRMAHVAATREYTVFKSQLPEAHEEEKK